MPRKRKLRFYLPAGELNEDAGEVWGVPAFSPHAQCWLVSWYEADGTKPGLTRPTDAQQEWIDKNGAKVEKMQANLKEWLKSK